eukprot:Pgem_evm1s206
MPSVNKGLFHLVVLLLVTVVAIGDCGGADYGWVLRKSCIQAFNVAVLSVNKGLSHLVLLLLITVVAIGDCGGADCGW